MADTSVFKRLRRLFSTQAVVRNIGGKKLKVSDTSQRQAFGNRNIIDRYRRVYNAGQYGYSAQSNYDTYSSFQQARLQLFRDYDLMDHDPIIASVLDIYADENSLDSADIPRISTAFDGINIKLMKCGSLEEGKRMINLARFYDLKIMLGCMVESSVGITAAAHLAGEVDKVDLDGNLLINNDPYLGVKVIDGKLILPNSNGLGISLNSGAENLL